MVKVEEALLALRGVFQFENGRVWKRYDFAMKDTLHDKGLITEPRGQQESVFLTDEELRRPKELADSHFATGGTAALEHR